MTGADFARLSAEAQESMIEQISQGLDVDDQASGSSDDLDMEAIMQAIRAAESKGEAIKQGLKKT